MSSSTNKNPVSAVEAVWRREAARVIASLTRITHHLLPAARGDLLEKLGRAAEAKPEFERAAANATHPRERELLNERAARCGEGAGR